MTPQAADLPAPCASADFLISTQPPKKPEIPPFLLSTPPKGDEPFEATQTLDIISGKFLSHPFWPLIWPTPPPPPRAEPSGAFSRCRASLHCLARSSAERFRDVSCWGSAPPVMSRGCGLGVRRPACGWGLHGNLNEMTIWGGVWLGFTKKPKGNCHFGRRFVGVSKESPKGKPPFWVH